MMDKFEEGKALGEALGEARGEARGEIKGVHRIAINMLKANKALEEIILFTGLTQETIAELKNEL